MLENPFGVGFDYIMGAKGESAVGAGLFATSAALGVLFPSAFLFWLFAPVVKADLGVAATVAYAITYLMFAASQSLVIPPVIIAVSIYLDFMNRKDSHASSLALQHDAA